MSYTKRCIEYMEDGLTEEQAIAKVQADRLAEPIMGSREEDDTTPLDAQRQADGYTEDMG